MEYGGIINEKLKFNSTLNHKQSDYKPYEVEVEKVVTLYGRQFEEMKPAKKNQ